MSAQFEDEFKVGDLVRGYDHRLYPEGTVLEVLHMDEDPGYGLGLPGNDPEKVHDPEHGWVWYFPHEVKPA